MRRDHGWEKPHDIEFWCLGNEMDGPWQMESKTAQEYGRIATEAAKMMRWIDPSIELAACGSSARNMATYGAWEDEVLAFGGACISLLNHADRVNSACLAQLVNTIAPILTETGGPAWRQTIFHPFAQFSNLQATNTKDASDQVKPLPLVDLKITGQKNEATMPPASWTVIRLRVSH